MNTASINTTTNSVDNVARSTSVPPLLEGRQIRLGCSCEWSIKLAIAVQTPSSSWLLRCSLHVGSHRILSTSRRAGTTASVGARPRRRSVVRRQWRWRRPM
jgi:hypothetical protein